MRMLKLLGLIIFVQLVTACAASGTGPDGKAAFRSRATTDGLVPLSGPEIEQMFRGTAFRSHGGEWTWVFGARGTAHARAFDGSWEIKDQKWEIDGDKLCRENEGAYPCVSIYAVDGVIRFGVEGTTNLERWAIVPYSGDI